MSARLNLTILGTSDLHGHVLDWDYSAGRPYADDLGNQVGLARCASIIREERARRGANRCLTLDAGDIIQGTPLTDRHARSWQAGGRAIHPMAAAMNAVGYDAVTVGNHEFNYGLGLLDTFEHDLDAPLLAANVLNAATGLPAFTPYVMRTIGGDPPLQVAVIGLTTPGVAIWDRVHVDGKLNFDGIVQRAATLVPALKAKGADVVIAVCHSGTDAAACSYGAQLDYPENAAVLLAEQVAGVDAVLVGHAHVEIPELITRHETTGAPVVLSEPLCWGMRVSIIELEMVHDGTSWTVAGRRAGLRDAREAQPDRRVAAAVRAPHQAARSYLEEVIAVSTRDMTGGTARFAAGPLIDLVNHVQADTIRRALEGTEYEAVPVLSVTSPYNRLAHIPRAKVRVRDLIGVYIHESTLLAVELAGAQLLGYLEHSAAYFCHVASADEPIAARQVCGAAAPQHPDGVPDFSYDIVGGFDEVVGYELDLAAPVGQRVRNLRYAGRPIGLADRFAVAVCSYRQAGGSGYPAVCDAPVLYDGGQQVRDLLIDWVRAQGRLDPDMFAGSTWRLTAGGRPLDIRA